MLDFPERLVSDKNARIIEFAEKKVKAYAKKQTEKY